MKMLLILWIIGIVECDKLDRTYLPPPSSVSTGEYPGELNLPPEFPKEYYPSSLEPESDVLTSDFSLTTTVPKYPNIALGIDRQGPTTVDTPKFLTNRPSIPVTENIYNIPSTVSSYDFAHTSTLPSVDTYYTKVEPVTIDNERYLSTQHPNVQSISTNLSPHRFSSSHYKGEVGNTSEITTSRPSTFNPIKHQQTDPQIYSQQAPGKSDGFIKKSQDFYDRNKSSPISISVLKPFVGTNAINISDLPQRTLAQNDINAVILRYENILTPEGYAYSFDTSNGIHIDENGTTIDGVKAKGSYSYTGDDGKLYSIEYTADENGFLPRGNHLPTAPPIPEAILKSIAQAEKNRKLGVIDDGSYDEAKYGHGRYQGLIGRIPSRQYNSVTKNYPGIKGNLKERTTNNEFEKVRIPANNDKAFDTNNYELDITFNTPNKYGEVKASHKDSYPDENENEPNGNNLLRTEIGIAINKIMKEPRNEFMGHTINASRFTEKSGKPNPKGYAVTSQTENNPNDIQPNVHSGYEYTQPQNMFNSNNKNFPSRFSIIGRNKPRPDDELQKDRITVKNVTSPDTSINSKSRKPGIGLQISRKTLYHPITSFDNANPNEMETGKIGITKPDISTFYNTGTGPTKNGDSTASEPIFTTLEPEIAFTNVRPNNQSSYTIIGNSKQDNRYPSLTLGSQYSMPTTSLPLKYSSPFTSTNSLIDFQTTPTASLVSSTLKPSMTSRQPTSMITSLPSGYQEQISGLQEVAGSRDSSTKPNFPGQSVKGFSEDMKSRSPPNNFRIPSSTVIGEEFSGPKQPQRFDPKYGYYY